MAAIGIPGVSAIDLVRGLYDYKPTAKVRREVTRRQDAALEAAGAEGRQVLRDIDTYLVGINRWYGRNRPAARAVDRADIYALNALKGQYLGEGGGAEVGNALLLDAARDKFGAKRGNRVYADLRGRSPPRVADDGRRARPVRAEGSGRRRARAGAARAGDVREPAAASARRERGRGRGSRECGGRLQAAGVERPARLRRALADRQAARRRRPQIAYSYPATGRASAAPVERQVGVDGLAVQRQPKVSRRKKIWSTVLRELARQRRHTLASVVAAQNAGATGDPRTFVWPAIAAVLAKRQAPSPLAAAMVTALDRWAAAPGGWIDAGGDGSIDGAGQAVIEAVWGDLAGAALCGRLGRKLCELLETLNSRFDEPPERNQYAGWHRYIDKDLRALLGRHVAGRYRTRFCGNGRVGACARSLWSALEDAGRAEAARQGTSDPSQWRLATKKLAFTPLPLVELQYTNRPSGTHQVMQFAP